eukprot:m.343141 g.343141  ORF g.343141 m.343141 type:complete len:293 (+) comp20627_c0_seq3:1704-2582(+)
MCPATMGAEHDGDNTSAFQEKLPFDASSEEPSNFFASSHDPLWHSIAFGTVSGTSAVVIGHPLDSIKVRLQTNQTQHLFRNLFRGIIPPLVAVVPAWSAVFFAYGATLKLLGRHDLPAVAVAGTVAGSAYSLIVCPLELVKVHAQRHQVSSLAALRNVHRSLGWRGLYRGLSACMLRDTSASITYYMVAEALNRHEGFKERFGSAAPLAAGAITGVSHCAIEFPFDTVKTRFQTLHHGPGTTYRQIIHGITQSAMDRGRLSLALVPVLFRAVIAHSASFYAVQVLKEAIGSD